jgi:uncharacterized protein with FMN-binding domain
MITNSLYHSHEAVNGNISYTSVQSLVPDVVKVEPLSDNPLVVKLAKTNGSIEYAAVGKAMGHKSEISVLVIASADKKIDNVIIIQPAKVTRFERLDINNFFSRFTGKDIHTPANLRNDIDTVSNATDSSLGVIKAVTNAAESLNTLKP